MVKGVPLDVDSIVTSGFPSPASLASIVNIVGSSHFTPSGSTPGPNTFTLEPSADGLILTFAGDLGTALPPNVTLIV